MLLKCCLLILILFLNIILLCNADEEAKGKNNTNCIGNRTIPFNINTRRFKKFKKKIALDVKSNLTANRLKTRERFLNEHFVMTCGGHVLSTFRLAFADTAKKSEKCPVLLVHGLFQSSDVFLGQDKEQSLALKLQDLGYDVWLANTRANKNNRVHIIFEPEINLADKKEYFNYSYEEFGTHDIAATVDFILTATKFKKLLYIGYSMGGTAFLVLNSLKPEYNVKFAKAYLLAPLGYHSYFPDETLKSAANRSDELLTELSRQGVSEIFPYNDENAMFSVEDCLGNKSYADICDQLNIQKIMGLKRLNNDVEESRGGSIRPLFHLAQNVRSGTFSRWDYGEIENYRRYLTPTPPKYDLGLVTVPTKIIYAPHDEFVSPHDIAIMAKDMANAKTSEVKRASFKHGDFVTSSDAMENVYAGIIEDLQMRPNICLANKSLGLFLDYIWIWACVPFIILLAIIAILLLDWNKQTHKKKHCKVGSR